MHKPKPFYFHLNRRWSGLALPFAIAGLLGLAGCGDSPTSNSGGNQPPTVTLQSLTVTGEIEVEQGMQSQLSVMANYSDGRNRDVTSSASYASSDSSIATVNATGLVTAVRTGTASITATYQEGGITRDSSVEVRIARQIPRFRVTVNVSTIRIIDDCDPGPIIQTGPGEFTYRVMTRFPGDSGDITLRETTSRIDRSDGQSISIGRSRTESIGTSTSTVNVSYRLTEWDANTPDSSMNNRLGSRNHTLSNGQWTGTGSNSITIGSGDCRAQLNYTFTATQTN